MQAHNSIKTTSFPNFLIKVLILLLTICLQTSCVKGQQCTRQYQGEVERCNAFVPLGTTIYVKNFTSYDELISVLQKDTARISAIPGDCSELMIRFTCRARLTECVQQGSLLFPRPNCMPVCTDASPKCDLFFTLGGNSANCNGTEKISGLPLYLEPNSAYTGLVNGTEVTVRCSNATEGEYVAQCFFPLAKKNNGQCGIACPDPMFSSNEYLAVDLSVKIGGWLSFFILAAVSITYAIDPQRKPWPMNIPYLICISAAVHVFFMVVMPTLLNIGKERNSHWCSDAATPARQEHASAACFMQALAIIYFPPHINAFLFVWTSIIIYQMVNINQTGNMKFYPWGAVCCAFLYLCPLVSIVAALSYKRIGYPRGSAFCNFWVTEEVDAKFPTMWTAATVVIPTLIFCVFICIELCVIIVLLYRAYKRVARLRKGTQESRYTYEKKIVQYMLWNLFSQTIFFAFYFDSLHKFKFIRAAYQEWIACFANDPEGDCHLQERPTYWLAIISFISAAIYGGIGVFIFGLHNHVWNYWRPIVLSYSSKFTTSGADSASENKRRLETFRSSISGDTRSDKATEDFIPMNTISAESLVEEREDKSDDAISEEIKKVASEDSL